MNSKQYNSYTFLVDIKKAKTQQQKNIISFQETRHVKPFFSRLINDDDS